MDWAGVAGTFVSSAASGGFGAIFGGLLGIGKQWLEARQQAELLRIKNEERSRERSHELSLIDKEIDKAVLHDEALRERADIGAMAEVLQGQDREIAALKPALEKAGPLINGFVALVLSGITALSKAIRPALTIYMMVIATVLLQQLSNRVAGLDAFQQKELIIIYKQVVGLIIELAGLSFAFWFVARPNLRR